MLDKEHHLYSKGYTCSNTEYLTGSGIFNITVAAGHNGNRMYLSASYGFVTNEILEQYMHFMYNGDNH